MMRFAILFVLLFFAYNSSFAQHAKVKKYTAPLAGTVVLRDVPDKYNAQVYSLEMPDPDATADQKKLQKIKDQIRKKYQGTKKMDERTTTAIQPPILGINYVSDSFSGIPPDNYTAFSNNNTAVCVMNDRITVHNATSGAFLSRKTLESFSTAAGLNNVLHDYRYDPKVVYDPQADRFISIMLNSTNQYNYIVVGFSQTNDPTWAWKFYDFYGDYANDTTWFDYPAISITQNEFFFTGNKILFNDSWQAGFKESVIYQVRKEDGYNGDSLLTYQIWDSVQYNNNYLRCLYPLNPGDGLLGPSQYFLSNRDFDAINDTVFLIQVPDTIGSSDSILTVVPVISDISYGVPPDARQTDTGLTLATNDGRVLGGFIEGNQIQFVSTSVDTLNGSSAIYHGIISNFNTVPSLHGQLFSIDTLDFGYPNISYTGSEGGNNQSIISFDFSGPHMYPGYGAIFFDGTGYSSMLTIKSGDSTINMLTQKEQRWGDYSGSQPAWNSLGIVWVVGIYGRKDQTYGNYLAQLASPYFTGVPSVNVPAPVVSNLYPNPAWEFVSFDFNVTDEQVFSFYIYDAQGRVIDKLIDKLCQQGKNIIQFNVASLLPGTYFLKAAGSKGENIPAHTFVRR